MALVQADLADTLVRIAEKGPAGFYEGKIAELIAAEMARNGGLITEDDLKDIGVALGARRKLLAAIADRARSSEQKALVSDEGERPAGIDLEAPQRVHLDGHRLVRREHQVRHHRTLVWPLLKGAIQLRECNDRHVEFLGYRLERA